MGAWGTGIFSDDVALDVKEEYQSRLKKGEDGKKITQDMIEANAGVINDQDEGPVFWFALASVQWKAGRLEDFVKEKALFHIKDGKDLTRWQQENPKEARKREKVLLELEQKLNSPQPQERKIKPMPKPYHCEWQVGDLFAYRFESDYAKENGYDGKYVYFVKVGEREWHPEHVIPMVYFYKRLDDEIVDINTIVKTEYIPQFFHPKSYLNFPDRPFLYLIRLITTSSRVIPKNRITYLGNIGEVRRPQSENVQPCCEYWRKLEVYMIDNYKRWLNL